VTDKGEGMKKSIVLILFLVSLGGLFSGCSDKQETVGPEAVWTVGMSQCNLGEPWRVQMNLDIKQAADKEPRIKIIFKDAPK
jgi:ABC-type sugar transport system substrate-binding protein